MYIPIKKRIIKEIIITWWNAKSEKIKYPKIIDVDSKRKKEIKGNNIIAEVEALYLVRSNIRNVLLLSKVKNERKKVWKNEKKKDVFNVCAFNGIVS